MENKNAKDKMIGQEEDEREGKQTTNSDRVLSISITILVCLTIILTASIIWNPTPVVVVEQLESCSLNELVVGQTYEVNGLIMTLDSVYRDYNNNDDLRLMFEEIK